MTLALNLIVALAVLTLIAMVIYDRSRSPRSAQFEDHLDKHMDTITEHRVRRNLNQGG
jgi:hypothetical protein